MRVTHMEVIMTYVNMGIVIIIIVAIVAGILSKIKKIIEVKLIHKGLKSRDFWKL